MALTDTAVRTAKPKDKAYKVADSGGLFLFVTPAGGKSWRFKFRVGGIEKLLTLGKYPQVSLSAARRARDEAKARLSSGADPAHDRKMAKIAAKVSAGNTFQSVAEDFIAVKLEAAGKADATTGKARWYLSHLIPALGSRPIAEIKPAELLAVLKRLEAKGHRETARRTRALASRIFRHGVAHALCEADPAALLGGALAAPIVKHRAAILDPAELGAFLRDVDAYGGGPVVKIAMQLSPHVFTRPGELRFGRWSEVDWDNSVWQVPAERTKLRRPHSVPLSRQSAALLRMLHDVTGGYELMFAGQRSYLNPMSENTLNQAFRRMGWSADEVTAHGLRATASTLLNESGKWHMDAIERALAHGHSDAVRGTYARGQHWPERVEMAQWWSDYLDTLRKAADAVPIRSAKSA
ncbi:integrase [Rhizorhabdus wittichii DC-6]|nr:integrase [Rhizorhabdus wittichii DC-6]